MLNQEYKIITLNVNGLQNPIKRSKVISNMKREKQQFFGKRPICMIKNMRN